MLRQLYLAFIAFALSSAVFAQKTYSPAKVVYDVSTPDATELDHILDRVSLLQNVYDNNSFEASIIIVLHEGSIPLFVKSGKHHQLIKRAKSLTLGEIIQFRLCKASARMQGYTVKDFSEFITIVPMADAEIIQLQTNGYAYLK